MKKVYCDACFHIGQAKSERVCKHPSNTKKYDTWDSPDNYDYTEWPKVLNAKNDCKNFRDKD